MTDKLVLKLNDQIVDIEQDDNGRYCLNDLYRASGSSEENKPNKYLRNKHCDVDVVKVNKGDSFVPFPEDFDSYVVLSGKGRGSKTFAPLKVVYKYAAFISKDFENAVYDAFTKLTTGDAQEAAGIASSITITPEIISRYEKLQKKLNNLIAQQEGKSKWYYKHLYDAITKASTGYTSKQLTGGFGSSVNYFKEKGHLPAMNAYVASLELMITAITLGINDYHHLAAMLKVETGKNKELLAAIN